MKRLLFFLVVSLLPLATWAADFSETNDEGYEISYTIVDGSDYGFTSPACEVANISRSITGTLTIPSTVENGGTTYTVIGIAEEACDGGQIQSVVFPDNLIYVGIIAFADCDKLEAIDIPNTIQLLDVHAFNDCDALTSVTIAEGSVAGESSIILAEGAIGDCDKLTYVYLGAGVSYLGTEALQTSSLKEIYSLNPTPPECDSETFYPETKDGATLYVPEGTRQVYQNAAVWCDFENVQEISITPPDITTLAATDVGQTSAVLNATIVKGTEAIEEQGFEYWVSSSNVQTVVVTDVSGDEMSITIDNLQTSTKYTYRAYAKTVSGAYYGENKSFTTQSDYDCYVDGFYYNITSTSQKTCAVTCLSPTTLNKDVYQGEIEIPTTVEIDGETYAVTGIDDYAFCYCADLISVEIPSSVTSMGYAAFYECTSLEKADIPSTVTSLGAFLFYDCVALKEVVIPSGFTSVPAYFCYQCYSLKEIVIPERATSISDCAFALCTGVESVTMNNVLTTIGQHAFNSCNMKEVVIPNSVTSMGAYAFGHCGSLETVTMSNSLKTMGGYTFTECVSLKSIKIPDSVTSMGDSEFSNCTSLEELTIGNSVKSSLGSHFCYKCTNLKTVKIPDSVTSIGSGAFCICTSLTTVTIGSGVESIGHQAFYSCSALEEVAMNNNIKTIGNQAFRECESLKAIDIPSSVTTIDYGAFWGCTSLEEIYLPNSITSLGTHVFYGCTGIKTATIDIQGTVEDMMFDNCSALTSVSIGDDVTDIDGDAFYKCTSLEEVVLGSGLTSLGASSFGNCPALSAIYSLNPEPPTCKYANNGSISPFDDVNKRGDVNKETCVLYVPIDSYEDYAYADTWKEFMNIAEIMTVETLDAEDVSASSATLKGIVTVGDHSFEVEKKGFELWKDGANSVVNTIYVDENNMTYTINTLTPETTYVYHAFLLATDGAHYGEDMEFTTLEDTTGINGISANSISEVEGIYSTSGQKLNSTQKGVNIIRYSDGTVKKLYVK